MESSVSIVASIKTPNPLINKEKSGKSLYINDTRKSADDGTRTRIKWWIFNGFRLFVELFVELWAQEVFLRDWPWHRTSAASTRGTCGHRPACRGLACCGPCRAWRRFPGRPGRRGRTHGSAVDRGSGLGCVAYRGGGNSGR